MHNSPTSILVVEPELQIAHASATGPCSAAHVIESVQRCDLWQSDSRLLGREGCSASIPVLFLVVAVLFVRVGHGPCSPLASALNDPLMPPDFGKLFLATAGAGAAFIGLLFVAISIHPRS